MSDSMPAWAMLGVTVTGSGDSFTGRKLAGRNTTLEADIIVRKIADLFNFFIGNAERIGARFAVTDNANTDDNNGKNTANDYTQNSEGKNDLYQRKSPRVSR